MFIIVLYIKQKLLKTKISNNRLLVKHIIVYHIMKYYTTMKNCFERLGQIKIYFVGEEEFKD